MSEQYWVPQKVYIDDSVRDAERVQAILARLPQAEIEYVADAKKFKREVAKKKFEFTEGKNVLLLTRQRGKFLSLCPAFTDSAVCCNYQTINLLMGCNIDCSYCFLQAYLNNPFITLFTNLEDVFRELRELIDGRPEHVFRFGTGEFTDSLALDHVLGLNKYLVEFFAARPNALLELKTKSAHVTPLLDLKHNGRTIIAWSVNTETIQSTEEHKSATIDERLSAAVRCIEAGYRVAFHFDPLIIHPGWKEGYRETVEKMKKHIPEEAIAWISYGSLRYVPQLKRIAQSRFRKTPIFSGEFIKGFDHKMRYFTPLRTLLYQTVHQYIENAFPNIKPYLCMEPEHIWEQSFGMPSPSIDGLTRRLDEVVTSV